MLIVDGRPIAADVLLVANNAYELDLFNVGERERLDEGLLHLYVAHGWHPRNWEEQQATAFTVESGPTLRAAIDGEPTELESPIRFSIEPRALRVLLPPQP